jgi:dolichol-phosphate mannosyltransferase
MSVPRVLVALATYNEIENLPSLVDEVRRVLPEADVLVIDDNSPDGTGKWCDERAAADSHVRCLHRAGKQGLGSATIAAMQWAIEHSYDVIATMDADWSHDPRHLTELVDATSSVDVAIGSRYCRGGAIEGWPLSRLVMSRVMNGLSRAVLRFPINDASGAFRGYRVAALRELDVSRIQAVGYSYLEEIVWLLQRNGATFAEVPITFHQRRAGASKISFREAAAKISTLIRLAFGKSKKQN